MCFGSVLFKPLVLKSHQRADQHFSAHLNPQNVTQNSHQFLFGLIFATSLAASGLSLTPEFQILSYKSLAASGFYPVLFLKKAKVLSEGCLVSKCLFSLHRVSFSQLFLTDDFQAEGC